MKLSKIWLCALVGLAGLILMGRHGQALSVASTDNRAVIYPSANNKVIIYPTADEKIDQLKEKGIQKIKNYGSYWLVEATDAQVNQLTQLYGERAVKENRLNRILLSDTSFDTTSGDPAIPDSLREEEGPGKRLRLVQFRGPVTPEWMRQIKSLSGAQLISYVPNNAYLVFMDAGTERELEKLHSPSGPIQWIGAYHPYYKIPPELRYASGTEPIKVRVSVVDRSQEPQGESGVFALGSVVAEMKRNGQQVVEMNVEPSAITKIAQLADVLWIQKVESQRLLDEVQDLIVATQTNGAGHGPSTSLGITNYLDFLTNTVAGGLSSFTNQFAYPVVDVADTGLDGPSVIHPSFYEFGSRFGATRVVYEEPTSYIDAGPAQLGCEALNFPFVIGPEDFYDHGTLVASVIAGYDVQPNVDEVCIYDVISNLVFASITPYTCSGTGTETGMFTFATSPCELVTNILVTCTSPGQEIFETLLLPTEITFTQEVNNVHRDASGFQFGLGISPFGEIGISRIWSQAAHTVGTPPVVVIDPTTFCINSLPSFIASAYGLGARIQNDSWSDALNTDGSNGGQYNNESQIYDVAVRDALLVGASNNVPGPSPLNQEFIVVFAANSALGDEGAGGNVGGFGDIRLTAPATAKNVITVGSSDSVRIDSSGCAPANQESNSLLLPPFTAFGPTLDGRFKPEIVAPGTTIYGARSELALFDDPVNGISSGFNFDDCGNLGSDANVLCVLTNLFGCLPFVACSNLTVTYVGDNHLPHGGLYQCNSGSSYAAPAVSGSIQLLWWYFENRLTNFEYVLTSGLTNVVGQALLQPSPAMAKAYLCNSARYLPITNPQTGVTDTLPSNAQGMGELDLLRMFDGVPRAIRDESSPRAIDSPLITTNPAPQQTYFSQTGQSYELKGQIASNGLPFRVSLAWTDAPGSGTGKELVNDLDLQVIIGGVTYKGNVFVQNVSVPGGAFDTVNNMESVFLNPIGSLGGIAAVTSGAPWQVVVRASSIAGNGVPNVGGPLNQDFAMVVYNAATNTLSDIPNLATNNSCQTAMDLVQFPFAFTNTLSKAVYGNVQPSPSVATGGIDEFFKIGQPTPGTVFNIDTFGSSFDTVLSVWSAQVVPQAILVRGDCGALTEVVANNDAAGGTNGLQSQVTFTADGSNDYFIVVEPHNDGPGGQMILNVQASQSPISLTPSNLVFGSQVEGTTSAVQTVTYQNGATVNVDISTVSITGPNAGDFLILSQTCAGDTINSGTNCFVIIAFAPTVVGLEQATLVFTDDATGSPRTVPLSGTGAPLAPIVCLSSGGPLAFPGQLLTTTSAVQSITITNCGTAPLNISSVSIAGLGSNDFTFVQSPSCTGGPIAPGGFCALNVTFNPQVAGTRQATLTITHNAAGSPTTLLLEGDGIPLTPAVCPGSNPVSFGNTVFVGNTGLLQSVIITNCGTAPLLINGVSITGTNASDFLTNSTTCGSVATGSTCAVGVTFAPTATGIRTAVLTINDNTGNPDQITLIGIGSGVNCLGTITVNPPAIPSPQVGVPYNQNLTTTGAKAPATFILAIGPMPPGLALTTSGAITGTPTRVGQFSFEVGLTDANGCSAEKLYTVFVNCPTITISPNSLPGGTEFVPYSPVTFTASGGTPPYTFSQTAGALPANMNISSNGVLSGTPGSPSSTFTVTVTDSNNCSASRIYTLTLTDPNPPITITITPTNLVAGVVGQNYNQSLVASGGSAPYSFTNSAGSLPPGLSLSPSGVLSGVPTTAGSYSLTVTATDSTPTNGQSLCTINITSLADLAVSSFFSPNPVMVDSNLTCSVTVTNLGPSPATGVTVSNSLPAGASLVSVSAGCTNIGDMLICDVGTLAAGASVPLGYVVTPTSTGLISATASVSANEADPITANNSATAGGTVEAPKGPYTIAPNPKAITDGDGDIVSVTLKGAGTMEVHLIPGNNPIDSIVLTNTDASSALTIQVKKARTGGGDSLVNIGSIVSDGGLKSITGKAVNLTGAGIQLGGSLGSVTVHSMVHSALTVAGSIKTVNVGTFDASNITAVKLGSVKLGTVSNTDGSLAFGIQTQQAGGTLSVANPRLKGKITTSSLSTGNFHAVVQ